MSKQLLMLITIVAMFAVFGSAQAQQPTLSGEPIRVLTEEQIRADLVIPSTANRRISNIDVQVHEDGVYVSFQMTVTRDGTSNTLSIIAILIGLFDQPRVSSLELENTLVSNYVVPSGLQREVTNLVLNSWTSYEAGVLALIPADQLPAQGFIMSDGRICNPRWGC